MKLGDLTCQQFVELVSDYIERALDPDVRARCDTHLSHCADCQVYLDQMRVTIRVMARLRTAPLSPTVRRQLLARFRNWKAS